MKLRFRLFFVLQICTTFVFAQRTKTAKFNAETFIQSLSKSTSARSYPLSLLNEKGEDNLFNFQEIDNGLPQNLKLKYPQIKTYKGVLTTNNNVTALITVSDNQIFGNKIENTQIIQFSSDLKTGNLVFEDTTPKPVDCSYSKMSSTNPLPSSVVSNNSQNSRASNLREAAVSALPTYSHGSTYRTYRFGLILSYWQMKELGLTTKAQGMAFVTDKLLLMNQVLGKEVATKFELIAQEENIIFITSADPYPDANVADITTLFPTSKTVMNTYVGDANYDWAFLFHPGATVGRAALDICRQADSKYQGGAINDNGLMLHELGHMYGGRHSYHLDQSNDLLPQTYGIVGNNGGVWFHGETWEVAATNMDTWTCGSAPVATGNTPPSITQYTPSGIYIPKSTPFVLTGQATDPDATASLSYSWQHMNVFDPERPIPTAGLKSLLWTWPNPSATTNIRHVPSIESQIANTADKFSILPAVAQPIVTRFIVRDNQTPFGGATYQDITFNVDDTAGPFVVNYPNTALNFTGGQSITVTWDVANTTNALVNAQQVNILISTDHAVTWTTLATAVPNNGSASVVLPNVTSSQCRIKVEGVGNIFYDMSNVDFSIFDNTTNDFTLILIKNFQANFQETTADYQFNFTKVGVFNNNVNVSFAGVPSGATMNVVTPLTTSGDFNVQIQNANTVAPGKYDITLTLTEVGGTITKSQTFTFIKKKIPESIPGKSIKFTYANSLYMGSKAVVRSRTTNTFTMALWMKSQSPYVHTQNNITYREPIIAFGENAYIYLTSNAEVGMAYKDVPYEVASGKVVREVWNHYALSVSPNLTVLYLNGKPVLTSTVRRVPVDLGTDLFIGRGVDWYKVNLGEYDEVKVFDKALSATEIQETMHRNDDYENPNLIEYFQFNEASGSSVSPVSFSVATPFSTTLSSRVTSTAPTGNANVTTLPFSTSLTPYGITGVSLKFATSSATNLATVHKINLNPNNFDGIPVTEQAVNSGQYWEINTYPASAIAEASFTVSYDVLTNDSPIVYQLYYRSQTSDGAWLYHSFATTIDATTNTISFKDLPTNAQYMIYKKVNPIVTLSKNRDVICPLNSFNQNTEIWEYHIEAANLSENVSVQFTNPQIQLSTTPSGSFTNPLIMPFGNGSISQTIYVKYTGTTFGSFNDTLKATTSANAQLQSANISFIYGNATARGNAFKLVDKNAGMKFSAFTDQIPNAFTIEFWMKPTQPLVAYTSQSTTSSHTQGMGRTSRFQMYCSNATEGRIKIGTSSDGMIESPAGTLQIGKWVHVAYTFKKVSASPLIIEKNLYINGALIPHTLSASAGITITWANMNIGGGNISTTAYVAQNFGGEIDEFRVWNTQRTQQQIQENIHLINDLSLSCAEGLIVYNQFNEPLGDQPEGANSTNLVGAYSKIVRSLTIGGVTYTAAVAPTIVQSNAPVGFGTSQTQDVTSVGRYDFNTANASIQFNAPVPNGKIVVSQISDTPFAPPTTTGTLFDKYWVIDNYGTNTGLSADVTFRPTVGFVNNTSPTNYNIYKRGSNEFGAWLTPANPNVIAGGGITLNGVPSFSQFSIESLTSPISICTQMPNTNPADVFTQLGFTTQSPKRVGFPESIPNGFIALESQNKGFVITRLTTAQINALTPIEGMLVYNTDVNCFQLWNGTLWNCISRSCNN